ncbi:MAG TPA: dTDP-4-dehydrorhamnose reductase [Pricia sp.]|nr:dTDP-4-dehydrorhamnose reductase [Pricia sp.]
MIPILVTGSAGQLGKSIQKIMSDYPELDVAFKSSRELDITNSTQIRKAFEAGRFKYCINCAAYTDVDRAEREPEMAFAVNCEGVENLAKACRDNATILIHISTDYVFDGEKEGSYGVEDKPNPINEYGKSKLLGERHIQKLLDTYFIVRTSWLYSEFGRNFYTTILRKARTDTVLQVTDDQTGCPTHAGNLAKYILDLVDSGRDDFGIHHFTDGEAMTWHGFAKRIVRENGLIDSVKLKKAENYRTFARRPKNSVLG